MTLKRWASSALLVLAGFLTMAAGSPPPIHIAALRGDLQKVKKLVEADPERVHARSDSGSTPLHMAARRGHAEVVRFFIDQGADVNALDESDETPLHDAAWAGDPEVTRLLLAHGAAVACVSSSMRRSPLHEHLDHGTRASARLVLAKTKKVNGGDTNGDTALHLAARKGYAEIVSTLLTGGAAVNAPDQHGDTPLSDAAREGHLSVCRLLVGAGAELDSEGYRGFTPVYAAVYAGHGEAVQYLLDQDASFGKAIHRAVCRNDRKSVERILQRNPTAASTISKGMAPIHMAAALGHREIAERLLGAGAKPNRHDEIENEGWAPLHYTARSNSTEMVRFLLNRGADINLRAEAEYQPLHLALWHGSPEVARLLVEQGADLSARGRAFRPVEIAVARADREKTDGSMVSFLVEHGANPDYGVDLAALNGSVKMLELLVEAGADVNCTLGYRATTPMHTATISCGLDTVVWLLAHGADPNAADEHGWTVLHYAAAFSDADIVRRLIKHGAKLDATGVKGGTPLHVAAQQGNMQAVRVLLQAGADPTVKSKDGTPPRALAATAEIEELLEAHDATP